ncbi:jg17758 [Pararge aegeria aegeria]|uniref:Jg17758 protein n=1 Tax=Pararge aegeria aegeria TaxID=348720 RepID=A0A8S4RCI7_9NEOP|nr:jg17758 [Pararge aegeria aegeria]
MLPIRTHNQPLHSVFAGEDEVRDFRHHPVVGTHHDLGGVGTNHCPKPSHSNSRLSQGSFKPIASSIPRFQTLSGRASDRGSLTSLAYAVKTTMINHLHIILVSHSK